MGMDRVSCWARCLRPRAWRAVPSSVQSRAGAGRGGGQVDPAPAAGGQEAVGSRSIDGFGGAQGGVVQAAEEGFQVLAAGAVRADGGEQGAGLGGAGDRRGGRRSRRRRGLSTGSGRAGWRAAAAVRRRSRARWRTRPACARVVAAAGLPCRAGAGIQREPDGGGVSSAATGRDAAAIQSSALAVSAGAAVAGAGVERAAEQGPAQDGGVGGAARGADQGRG